MRLINRNYSLLWWGQLVSAFGDKVQAVALTWWIIQSTGSTLAVGTYMTVSTLPGLVFGFAGGVVADRVSRRTLIVVTDLARGVLILFLTFLLYQGSLSMGALYGVAVVFSLCTSLFNASIGALMPDLVSKDELVKANGLLQSAAGVVSIAGFALGGILVALFPLVWLFLFNGLSFLLSGISEAFIRVQESHLAKSPEEEKEGGARRGGARVLKDLAEGFRYIRGHGALLATTIMMSLKNLFILPVFVYLPELAKEVYVAGPNGLGYLNGVLAAGNLVGAGLIIRWRTRSGAPGRRVLAAFIAAAGLAFLGLAPVTRLWIALCLFAVAALADTMHSITVNAAVQLTPPAKLRGRVLSVYYTVVRGMQPLAFGAGGLLRLVAPPASMFLLLGGGLLAWSGLSLAVPMLTGAPPVPSKKPRKEEQA